MDDRLYRSRDDRMLAGVAGGLAEMWGADPSLVRIVWALLVLFTGGLALVVYIVMALVVPERSVSAGTVGDADGSATGFQAPPRTARSARRARGGGLPGGLIAGLILIAIGAFFLARQFIPQLDFDWFWPLILIGIGVLVLVGTLGRGPDGPDGPRDPDGGP
jgi:phage shock protein C